MNFFSSFLIGITILFGISAQMLLLDIRIKDLKKTQRIFFGVGNLLVLAVNMALSLILPPDQHMKIYVLVIHVPIFLIFWITTKTAAIKVVFALFTAVFMIYPANVVLTIISKTAKWLYPTGFYISYIAVCAVMLTIIYRFFKPNFNYLNKNFNGISFLKLCLLPLTYNISNYWLGMYNFTAAISTEVFSLRILIFIITLTAYILILDIAKSTREKEVLQGVKMVLSLQLESANQQLSALEATQEQSAIYRHDMRHHFALIGGYLAAGDSQKAEEYVRSAQADIDEITPHRYCKNNTVNLILSSCAAKAKTNGVALSVEADLPQSLSLSETELCTLLSNGLENAIMAAAQVADDQFRKVRISCQTHKDNLLIFIENSFTGEVAMENGLPQSRREGHGFGVKSMAMIAEKYNGYCSFEAKGELFTLRIVLPLDK
ncbi:GHKL domain-containing protein [Desulfitobacterium sp. THU1]|uniref:sensor histidine kinase n=1 Tax=Desulfitobacterium sp. THU1 TaxID=3138072 RepID=UPI00311E3A82